MDDELHGVNTTAEGSEPSPQAQTPAPTPDVEQVVNRLVEQRVSERFANLDTEVERRIQSTLAKRENKAKKQFQEEQRVIERMAQRNGWDPERKKTEMAAALEAANYASYVETDDAPEAFTSAPVPQFQQRQPEPSSQPQRDDTETRFRQYIKDTYLFDPKEEKMDYAEILNADINDERVQAFLDVATTKRAEIRKRRTNAESVKKGIDEYGPTGGLTTGSAAPPLSRLEQVTDPDAVFDIAVEEEWEKINKGRR